LGYSLGLERENVNKKKKKLSVNLIPAHLIRRRRKGTATQCSMTTIGFGKGEVGIKVKERGNIVGGKAGSKVADIKKGNKGQRKKTELRRNVKESGGFS